jgi:hypothetical protein
MGKENKKGKRGKMGKGNKKDCEGLTSLHDGLTSNGSSDILVDLVQTRG